MAAAMTCGTGSPSRAARIAGARRSFTGMRPNFAWSANHPSTVPGTVQAYGV